DPQLQVPVFTAPQALVGGMPVESPQFAHDRSPAQHRTAAPYEVRKKQAFVDPPATGEWGHAARHFPVLVNEPVEAVGRRRLTIRLLEFVDQFAEMLGMPQIVSVQKGDKLSRGLVYAAIARARDAAIFRCDRSKAAVGRKLLANA